MDMILNYVKPELCVLAIVLYLFGVALKQCESLPDKFIPFILGTVGITLSLIYVLANSELCSLQNVLMAIFTAIVQGVLVTGLSTYVNQITKQLGKDE